MRLLFIDDIFLRCLNELLQPPFCQGLLIVRHLFFLVAVRKYAKELTNPRKPILCLHSRRMLSIDLEYGLLLACKDYVLTCELLALTSTFSCLVNYVVVGYHGLLRLGLNVSFGGLKLLMTGSQSLFCTINRSCLIFKYAIG